MYTQSINMRAMQHCLHRDIPMSNIFPKILVCLLLFTSSAQAIDLTGTINSHDPAGLIKDGNRYYQFTTGDGIWYSYSDNLTHWTPGPSTVFPVGTWPSWINSAVPGFGGHFWAPDAIYMNGYYYLYYSCSTFGSSRSAIGVVRTSSLSNPNWQDLGMVVSSNGSSSAINAIDPALFRDSNGRVYMSYGSWFGGIGVVEINPSTGKTIGGVTHLYGGNHQSIEAPYIVKEGSYYYLFVNRGNCCQGVNSTYYIEVGRSTSVTGPYSGWRTVLSSSGKYIGPGHFGLLREGSCNYVSIHYYDGNDNGNPKLDILNMTFSGGWPSLTRNFTVGNCSGGTSGPVVSGGTYRITPRHSGKAIDVENCGSGNGINVRQWSWLNNNCQKWIFTDAGSGSWRISPSHATGQALDLTNCSGSNSANIQLWGWLNNDCQKWELLDRGGGFYQIRSRASGKCLDVSGNSSSDGANIIQYTCNSNSYNQQFQFESASSSRLAVSEELEREIESAAKRHFAMYPNPTRDLLTISMPSSDDIKTTYGFFNNVGQLIKSGEFDGSEFSLKISDLPSGIYFVKLENNSFTTLQKIQKQ